MMKKILLALVIASLATGGVFAQDVDDDDSYYTPNNIVAVDIGPLIIGLAVGAVGNIIGGEEGVSTTGFGIGVQYERQILPILSAGGRFSVLTAGIGIPLGSSQGGGSADALLNLGITSLSFEGHARFYPTARAFFLDGMLGFAIMTLSFDGSLTVKDEFGNNGRESISYSISRGFLKLGAKIGWRVDFGSKGGFIFEPSFGYYLGVGMGDTFGEKLQAFIRDKFDGEIDPDDFGDMDEIFGYAEKFVWVGGPRVAFNFGWRF